MENKEQDFINRYKNVQESIVKAMGKALERAIGNKVINFEKCEGDYLDVYPLIGAVLQLAIIHELKEKFKNELMREISNPISEKIEDIARESMNDLVENASEKKYRFRLDYMDEELTVDEFIRGRMKKVVDSNIETMVESKAKSFVNELRKRYDMAFAAFVVDSMRKQNMLKDEKIAELLKDNPDER